MSIGLSKVGGINVGVSKVGESKSGNQTLGHRTKVPNPRRSSNRYSNRDPCSLFLTCFSVAPPKITNYINYNERKPNYSPFKESKNIIFKTTAIVPLVPDT